MNELDVLVKKPSYENLDLENRINSIKKASEVIAQSLMEMIYDGELRPGDQLKQEAMADLFGVSRIPVRDAFLYLVSIGLAVNIPRKGIFVAPVSRNTLSYLYETRCVLEGGAIRLVVQRCDNALLSALSEIIEKQEKLKQMSVFDVKHAKEIDGEFHRTLYSKLGNPVLSELIFNNWLRIKQARSLSRIQENALIEWIDKSIVGHKQVLKALLERNEEYAEKIVLENIRRSEKEVLQHLEESGWLTSG
ncbi:MAG: GntR family transcriptional regulator [Spirochaetales bacterium]